MSTDAQIVAELESCPLLQSMDEVKANVKTLNVYCEIIALKIEKLLGEKDIVGLRRLVSKSQKIRLAEIASSDVKILSVLMEAEGVMALL